MLWSHTAEVSKCFKETEVSSFLHILINYYGGTMRYFFNRKGLIDLNYLHDELHDSIFFLRA